ncbi:MAG: uracil-DNA glycosylase [Sumerlaeia bacterium]
MQRPTPDPLKHQLALYRSLGFGFLEGIETAEAAESPADEPGVDLFDHEAAPSADHGPALVHGEGMPLAERRDALDRLAAERIAACTMCRLCHSRTQTVPGEGNPAAELAIVGEGPGANEDATGRPFVGRAGELLDKIIAAMKFQREDVFIGNVVKCRPPSNRQPEPDEMAMCLPYLEEQLAIVRPRVIVTLGKTALVGLMPEHARLSMTRARGTWMEWRGIPVMPTYHPAYLLRDPRKKRVVWEDMQKVMDVFGKR